ncbi:unnamed protein product [Diatraea saccharalis]|uniref:Uncharacterized protein n=1 Tax=Diatraea saccharalis TaxID=40085 RepID=A0A9N9RF62_9NEOP|nr:unnamed protein product [Diatraea saccharalis]
MVGLFVIIGVLRRLRSRPPEPPNGVPSSHQPREAVTSHYRTRYTRIFTARSTSLVQHATSADRVLARYYTQGIINKWTGRPISTGGDKTSTVTYFKNTLTTTSKKLAYNITTEYHIKRWQAKLRGRRLT